MKNYWKRIIKLINIIKNPTFIYGFLRGVSAGTEHLHVLRLIKCNSVIDVGANCGQFTLVARSVFPHAEIHSIEPVMEAYQKLSSLVINDKLITCHQVAIGLEEKKEKIHIAQAADSSSLLPISDMQEKIFPGTAEKEVRETWVKPLQKALDVASLPTPILLKIDVQGFEYQVLQGSEPIINKIEYVYVECSFVELYQSQYLADEVINFLQERDFELIGIYDMHYDKTGLAIQGDLLFKMKSS